MRLSLRLVIPLALLALGTFSGSTLAQAPKPVTFEWDCPSCVEDEVIQFNFYESTVSTDPASGTFNVIAIIPADQAQFPTELQLNTGRHWFYITAVNEAGESGPSNVVTVQTQVPRALILRKRTAG